jgi:FtsH-binding integral membrane protein
MSGYFIVNNLTLDFGVKNPYNPSFFETILGIVMGVFVAVGVIGLMFILQSWPGGWAFLIMGNSGLLLTSLISLYRFRDFRVHPTKAVLWRFLLYGSGTFLFALGKTYL